MCIPKNPSLVFVHPKQMKSALVAADLLNDQVLPFYEEMGMPVLRILTDRGMEYCEQVEKHEYQLKLELPNIDFTKTKVKSSQTNLICERFHKTVLNEFYQIAFRKKIDTTIEELQLDLDDWLKVYNEERTHQGKMCCGRTPMQTLLDAKQAVEDKKLTA